MERKGTQHRIWLFAFVAIFCASVLFAEDTSVLHAKTLHQENAVTADFDGDQRPDTAFNRSWQNYSQVEIQFGSGIHVSFGSPTPGETTLVAMDIDRDNDTDLIVFATKSEIPAAVWLNDGHGFFTTPKLWRIDASFPVPPPANHPDNDERSSLTNAVVFLGTLQTPDAKLVDTTLTNRQEQQTFHAFFKPDIRSILLASSQHSRSPPFTKSL